MSTAALRVQLEDLDEETERYFRSSKVIALDSETRGLVPTRDRLCLVQLHDGTRGAIVKIARGATRASAPRLKRVLEGPALKVIHYARFDLATLRHHLGIRVTPVFCTLLASKLARTYADSHSLKDVVRDLLAHAMDKTSQQSDWGGELFTEAQLNYALADVEVLLPLYEKLRTILMREELLALAEQCFAAIPLHAELDLAGYDRDLFRGGSSPR